MNGTKPGRKIGYYIYLLSCIHVGPSFDVSGDHLEQMTGTGRKFQTHCLAPRVFGYCWFSEDLPGANFSSIMCTSLLNSMSRYLRFFGIFGVYSSLQYLSLSDATVLTFLVPIFTGFSGALFLKEPLSLKELLAGCAYTTFSS